MSIRVSNASACTTPKSTDLVLGASYNTDADTGTNYNNARFSVNALGTTVRGDPSNSTFWGPNTNPISVSSQVLMMAANGVASPAIYVPGPISVQALFTSNVIVGLVGNNFYTNNFVVTKTSTPTSSADTTSVSVGQIWSDGSYIYVCVSNTVIKRVALTTF